MQHAIRHIQEELASVYTGNELSAVTRLLLCYITGFDYTGLLVNKNTIFSEKQNDLLNFYIQELKKGRPIQYVLGFTEFCGLKFRVDERVLIPRPETEELVEWIVSECNAAANILDIGTGSGCIPVSLKHLLPDSIVSACDISTGALELAAGNAADNQAEVHFFQCDILQKITLEKRYDVIVSNPPYIPLADMAEMESHVVDYEPHIALFVPDYDPLLFYKRIAEFAQIHLSAGGYLYFEIHRQYARECLSLLKKLNFSGVELRKDIHANERMVRAIRN
jgi:release factor glutamine methyltransferase